MSLRLLCFGLVFQGKFTTSLFAVFELDMQSNEPAVEAYDTSCNPLLFAFQHFQIEGLCEITCQCEAEQTNLVHVVTRVGFFSVSVTLLLQSLLD